MADDAAGLIEALELGPVHLVGASMGGMVAQVLAARRPDLVRSLTSIMSNTGSRVTGQPALGLSGTCCARRRSEREAYIEHSVALFGLIGSEGADPDEIRELAELHYERDTDRAGDRPAARRDPQDRQPRESSCGGSRRRPSSSTAPRTSSCGRPAGSATARLIPGARLITIDRMGHDLPRWAWPRIIDAIAENAGRAADERP